MSAIEGIVITLISQPKTTKPKQPVAHLTPAGNVIIEINVAAAGSVNPSSTEIAFIIHNRILIFPLRLSDDKIICKTGDRIINANGTHEKNSRLSILIGF